MPLKTWVGEGGGGGVVGGVWQFFFPHVAESRRSLRSGCGRRLGRGGETAPLETAQSAQFPHRRFNVTTDLCPSASPVTIRFGASIGSKPFCCFLWWCFFFFGGLDMGEERYAR